MSFLKKSSERWPQTPKSIYCTCCSRSCWWNHVDNNWHVSLIAYGHSLRKQPTFCDATSGFPTKWRLRNEHRNSILMTHYSLDLGSASDWLCRVKFALTNQKQYPDLSSDASSVWNFCAVSQTSFCRGTRGGIVKFRCFLRLLWLKLDHACAR